MNTLTRAASDVLAERERQISAEGWTPQHDATHWRGEMALAAACYASNAAAWAQYGDELPAGRYVELSTPGFRWPWAQEWWKPKSQRRDLIRAAALLLAEIERLDRAAGTSGVAPCGESSWCNRADCPKCNPQASPTTNAPRSISEPILCVAVPRGPLEQAAAGMQALDEGHDPLCMAVLRGKACTCGVPAVPEGYEKMRGGKPASHWRDNALEAAAQIAEAYRSHPGVAADIRAMKSTCGVAPSHGETLPSHTPAPDSVKEQNND